MLLADILSLFIDNSNDLIKPDPNISRLVQIYFKTNDLNTPNYVNYGGNLSITQKQIKKVCNYLSNKNYVQYIKQVKCYTYNNKKLYIHNSNADRCIYKEEINKDFQYGEDYLMVILDEHNLKSTHFPMVHNYYDISTYTEKYYTINNEITVIFKEYDINNIHMCIQFNITDNMKSHLSRLQNTFKFKQINGLLDMI